ncbi:serine/threonine-protein kinase fray2 isoform X2 [Hyalella azteca]|nr:serine/threonine-protein kinase fray2 isoform X2 [Hyalella azteca]
MAEYQVGKSSRYVDYTSEEGGAGGPYSSYDFSTPDRPPRRVKSSSNHDRLREEHQSNVRDESLDRRNRNNFRNESLDRRNRNNFQDESLERRNRSNVRNESVESRNRSLDRGLDSRLDRSDDLSSRYDRSLDRLDRRDIEQGLDDRHVDRSVERFDRRDRNGDRLDKRDRRDKSIDRLERTDRSLDRLNVRDRELNHSADRRQRSLDRLDDRTPVEDRIERRHRSRSRELLADNYPNQVYLHPGTAGGRGGSDRGDSDYVVRHDTHGGGRVWDDEERRAASRAASEIYASTRFPRPQSQMSQYTYRSGRHGSDVVSVKTKTTANGKLVMETMTAPHPCCPNTRSCCCLMVLLNLGLLLITLGFVVVLQLYDPPFVWYVGLSMLIFGFLVLFGSLIYCVFVC